MNQVEAERAELVSQFRGELESFRERMDGSCWQSLEAALEPTLRSLGADTEHDAEVPAWAAAAKLLDESIANDVSEAVKKLSLALKDHYRSIAPRDSRISDAIAFLYIDVASPLWAAHPNLEPIELRNS
jgi:hypothetical protein